MKTVFVNIVLARSNSMNKFYAHINVTESYCSPGSRKTLAQAYKTMFDAMQPDVLPKCPVQVFDMFWLSGALILASNLSRDALELST
jgi:hypothetical protein